MDNRKITHHQLFKINAMLSLGGSILVIGSTLAGIAKQDTWIVPIISTIFGFLVMLIYYYLGSRCPGMTLIGMSKKIFGKWLGFIISVCYIFVFLTSAAEVPWFISSYIGRWLHETPAYFINILFVAGVIIAVLYGVEAIARASEIFYFFVTVLYVLFVIMIAPNIKPVYFTPILAGGFSPVLKGSFFLSCYITFSAINVMMIFPYYVNNVPESKKALMKSQLWAGLISFLNLLLTILVLGYAMTAKSSFPTLLLAGEIRIGEYLTRMEYIISITWLVTTFMISLAFFFSTVTSISEVIGLKDQKKIVLPVGLIVLILSKVVFPNALYQANWDNMVYAPLITTFGFIIPFVMMIVYCIKKRFLNIQ